MPQLDTSSFTSQLFWLIICFFSMMFIMSKFIIPKIAEIMEQRQRKIDSYLNKAANFKQQAEEALLKYQEALAKATAKADKSLADTKAEMEQLISTRQNELENHLRQKIKEGEAEISKGKDEALKQVRAVSQELALDVVKKIGITSINAADIKAALKDL